MMGTRVLAFALSLALPIGLASLLPVASITAAAQERTERLILKDGSYQSVEKYELQGDRVHYLSAERYEWEDIPSNLIDWDATNKYNKDLDSNKTHTTVAETLEERAEREKEEANSPEIAPGVRLPGSGGVFLFDQYQGKPELGEIIQNGSSPTKTSSKTDALRAKMVPIPNTKQNFELKGEHAQTQSHVPRPTIYIDIDEGEMNLTAISDRFRIVRAEVKKDVRVVGNVKLKLSGKVKEQANVVPATAKQLGTGQWIELTPTRDLAPGEYAVVEMLGPDEMNLYVWDFGVNAAAPANPNTWQPVAAK